MTQGPTIRDNMPRHDRLRYIEHGLVGSDSAAYLNVPEQRAAVQVAGSMALQLVDDTRNLGFQGAIERLAIDLGQAVSGGEVPQSAPAWTRDLPKVDPDVVAQLGDSIDRARASRRRPTQVPSRPAHE